MMIKKIQLYAVLAAMALYFTSCLDKYPDNAIEADKAVIPLTM